MLLELFEEVVGLQGEMSAVVLLKEEGGREGGEGTAWLPRTRAGRVVCTVGGMGWDGMEMGMSDLGMCYPLI